MCRNIVFLFFSFNCNAVEKVCDTAWREETNAVLGYTECAVYSINKAQATFTVPSNWLTQSVLFGVEYYT